MANQEWDLGVLAAMEKAKNLQNNTSGVDNTAKINVADTFHLTKGGQQQASSTPTNADLHAIQEKRRIQALEAQRKSALASLSKEKSQVDPAYHTALSNVAGQSARGARNLAEYLAQRGQTQSGIAAQGEMQRQSDLLSSQTALEQERARALEDIAMRESQVWDTYNLGVKDAAYERQGLDLESTIGQRERERQESISTVGQYFNDYAAQINKLQQEGDPHGLIPYLQMARQDKISGQQSAEAAAAQQEFENWLALQKYNLQVANSRRTASGGGSTAGSITMSKDEAFGADYDRAASGALKPSDVIANRAALIGQYGLAKYNQILKAAEANYRSQHDPQLRSQMNQWLKANYPGLSFLP